MPTEELLRRITNHLKSQEASQEDTMPRDPFGGQAQDPLRALEEIRARANSHWNVDHEFLIRSHRKFFGRILVFVKRAIRKSIYWYVHPFKQNQTAFNMDIVQSINEIRNLMTTCITAQERIGNLDLRMEGINESAEALERKIMRQEERILSLEERIISIDEKCRLIESVGQRVEELAQTVGFLERVSSDYQKELSRVGQLLNSAEERLSVISSRVWRLKETAESDKNVAPAVDLNDTPVLSGTRPEFDYLMFEAKYRGSFDLIQTRQRKYLDEIAHLDSIVDVGCGRGEFVALMTSEGKDVVGVEINEDMYSMAKSRGLNIVLGDGIEYLHQVPDLSLGVIFCAHVIEHLEFARFMEFLDLSARKLHHGGKLILESPNPTTLLVFANTFYMDPTHVRPVHPATLEFALESLGFRSVRRFDAEPASDWDLPLLAIEGDAVHNLQAFNQGVQRLNRLLYGPQDYAVVATR